MHFINWCSQNLVRKGQILFSPFYRWGNWGLGRVCFFKQLGSGGALSWPQVFLGFTQNSFYCNRPGGIAFQCGRKWHVACLCRRGWKVGKVRDLIKSLKGFYFSGWVTLFLSVEPAGWKWLVITKRFCLSTWKARTQDGMRREWQ